MQRFLCEACTVILCLSLDIVVGAQEPMAVAILDKAIAASGSPEKFANAKGFTWKANWKHGGFRNCESQATVCGIDRQRFELWDNQLQLCIIQIIDGDRSRVNFGGVTRKMRGDELATRTQEVYLEAALAAPFLIKSRGLKYKQSPDERIGDRPAAVLAVTGPDGRDFMLYFDKESGLPVRTVAMMPKFPEQMCMREITLAEYKDFDGVKKATRLTFKTDGAIEHVLEVTAFELLKNVDPKTFLDPK